MIYDVCIIGGGIVGLATARAVMERRPGASILLLEKEPDLARHQTGHNSGVIHAGIYYAPGSLKARLCREGERETKAYCEAHDIAYDTCGKLVVATNALEANRLSALIERARANQIDIEPIDAAELKRREPAIEGVGAILVPQTGIVDYRLVCASMGREIVDQGGRLELDTRVDGITEAGDSVTVAAGDRRWQARKLIVCAGLQSDRLARLAGLRIEHRILPFRGEYFRLPAEKSHIVRHLIYPVPDPELPFLGVHLTRTIDGGVTVGPNAVLGLAREGYAKLSFDLRDACDMAAFAGSWRLLQQNLGTSAHEVFNSFWKRGYLAACRKYCPSLTLSDLLPMEAGIRAQAVLANGRLEHDFLFVQTERMLHVCNAPSPAATSAIPIGRMIVDRCFNNP